VVHAPGDTYDDPSEDALFEILGDIEAGEAVGDR
jgi:hypothetical protein